MPISKTVYATVFILDFVAHWNDFMWPFLVMTGAENRTIQLAVQSFFGTQPVHYSAIMASLVVSAIPMIVMFIFMQRYYVEGIASTGIKGWAHSNTYSLFIPLSFCPRAGGNRRPADTLKRTCA